MSILQGKVTNQQVKTSKKGNEYQRVEIENITGHRSWWTSFADRPMLVGETVMCAVKQMGDGEVIDDYELDGDAPQAASKPPESTSKPSNDDSDVWRKKDLRISSLAIFGHIWAGSAAGHEREVLDKAIKMAIQLEKRVNAYVSGADIDGMKQSLQDEVAQRAQESDHAASADNTDVGGAYDPNVPPNTGEPAGDNFDDDIPF